MNSVPPVSLDLNDPEALKGYHHTDKWIQMFLIQLGKFYNKNIFIETGTQAGNTVAAVKEHFQEVYSIEINAEFVQAARKRFQEDGNVFIIEGSSGQELHKMLLDEGIVSALFWLDAHGEGKDTAEGDQLFKELKAIEDLAPSSIVVIDDVIWKGGVYEINYCYNFMPPADWRSHYIHNMSLLIMHKDDFRLPASIST